VSSDLELALRLSAYADDRSLAAAGAVRHWRKADRSLVTEADLAIERAMIARLAFERPADGILAEESGAIEGTSGRDWILDPIDGTADFVAGGSCYGTHIALSDRGRVLVAVITRPRARRRWWAAAGQRAWTNTSAPGNRPLHVSAVAQLHRARVGGLLETGSPVRNLLGARATWVDDKLSVVAALIEGRIDAVVDDAGDPWDIAPATLLVMEAGGRFTDPSGGQRLDLGGAIYTNGLLDEEVHGLLGNPRLEQET